MKTLRIRIAVVIDTGGEWNATGWGGQPEQGAQESIDAMELVIHSVGPGATQYWVEVELPIPPAVSSAEPLVIEGRLFPAELESKGGS